MVDKTVLVDPEKELLEKEVLSREIKYLQSFMPDVFSSATGLATYKPGRAATVFWIECKGVNCEYFSNKFTGCDMVNTCESYFSALRTGYPMWEV